MNGEFKGNNRVVLQKSLTNAAIKIDLITGKVNSANLDHYYGPEQERRINDAVAQQYDILESAVKKSTGRKELEAEYKTLMSREDILGLNAGLNIEISNHLSHLGGGTYLMSAYFEDRLISQRVIDGEGKPIAIHDIFYLVNDDHQLIAGEVIRENDEMFDQWGQRTVIYPVEVNHSVQFKRHERASTYQVEYKELPNGLWEYTERNFIDPDTINETIVKKQVTQTIEGGALVRRVAKYTQGDMSQWLVTENPQNTENYMVVRYMEDEGYDLQYVFDRKDKTAEASDDVGILTSLGQKSILQLQLTIDLTHLHSPKLKIGDQWMEVPWPQDERGYELYFLSVKKPDGEAIIIIFDDAYNFLRTDAGSSELQ